MEYSVTGDSLHRSAAYGRRHGIPCRRRTAPRARFHHACARTRAHLRRFRAGGAPSARLRRRCRFADRRAARRGIRPRQRLADGAGARARPDDYRRRTGRRDVQHPDGVRARRRGAVDLADRGDQPPERDHHPDHRGLRIRSVHRRADGQGHFRRRHGAQRVPDRRRSGPDRPRHPPLRGEIRAALRTGGPQGVGGAVRPRARRRDLRSTGQHRPLFRTGRAGHAGPQPADDGDCVSPGEDVRDRSDPEDRHRDRMRAAERNARDRGRRAPVRRRARHRAGGYLQPDHVRDRADLYRGVAAGGRPRARARPRALPRSPGRHRAPPPRERRLRHGPAHPTPPASP